MNETYILLSGGIPDCINTTISYCVGGVKLYYDNSIDYTCLGQNVGCAITQYLNSLGVFW
jgi:hypothetical protein